MEQELDYADMLEIPVSTVNVVKKKSLFKRKNSHKEEKNAQEDLKDMVVDSVNERVGAYVYAEDLSDPPAPEKEKRGGRDRASIVIFAELVAICLIAASIFVTNIFVKSTVINTFLNSLTAKKEVAAVEPAYSDFTLTSVVSELSDAEVKAAAGGYLSFQAETAVYPVCDGKISSVVKEGETYTVQIAHTSTFKSVITGLNDVYCASGDAVKANLPFAHTDGKGEVRVSLYNGETLLRCSVTGVVPVWAS